MDRRAGGRETPPPVHENAEAESEVLYTQNPAAGAPHYTRGSITLRLLHRAGGRIPWHGCHGHFRLFSCHRTQTQEGLIQFRVRDSNPTYLSQSQASYR